jgi:transketolase
MSTETVSRPFGRALVEYGTRNDRVVVVTNDLTNSCEADEFRAAFPDRYISMGMAEQNLAGVLSGLAREGMIPVYPTFAVFATRRPYEQIALNIAYPALPVRIFGFLPGLSTPGGVTHQSIDDLGLMSMLPNMTVLEVGDATEVETVWDAIDDIPGPVYCRMLRGLVPRRFDSPLRFGEVRELAQGRDVLLITTGLMTGPAMEVVRRAHTAGVGVRHVHVSTIKPLPAEQLARAIAEVDYGVVTVENHLIAGGLGAAVAGLIAEHGLGRPLVRVGLDDTFATGGEMSYLLDRFGLGPADVADAINSLLPLDMVSEWESVDDGSDAARGGLSAVEAL